MSTQSRPRRDPRECREKKTLSGTSEREKKENPIRDESINRRNCLLLRIRLLLLQTVNADERCGSKTLRRGIKSALPVSETKERPSSSLFRFLRRKEKKKARAVFGGWREAIIFRERALLRRKKKEEDEKKREKKSGKKMEEQKEQKEEKEKEKEEKEEHFHTKSVKVVVTHTQKNMYGRRRRRRRKQKEFKRKPFLLRAKRR